MTSNKNITIKDITMLPENSAYCVYFIREHEQDIPTANAKLLLTKNRLVVQADKTASFTITAPIIESPGMKLVKVEYPTISNEDIVGIPAHYNSNCNILTLETGGMLIFVVYSKSLLSLINRY